MKASSPPHEIVVCSHLPGEGHFVSDAYRLRPVLCVDEFDYWAGLSEMWDSDLTIVNVEHDIEVEDGHLDELLACSQPLCGFAYRCHWVSTGIDGGVIAAGTGERDVHRQPAAYYLQGGEEWAAWSAIGLVKFTPEARIGPLRRESWSHLELAVEAAVKRPWHMHWPPVPHHHW